MSLSLEESNSYSNKKRSLSHDEDDSGFEEVSNQSPKRIKTVLLRDPFQNPNKPVCLDVEDTSPDSDELEYEDMDPDFRKNMEQTLVFKNQLKTTIETEKTYNMFRLAEQNLRAGKVADDDEKLDPVIGKDKKILKFKAADHALNEHLVEADVNGLLFLPCKPPITSNVDSVLGDPLPAGTFCFGCSYGIGFPHLNGTLVENLEKFMREVIPNSDPIQAAIKISVYYEKYVRAVANKNLEPSDKPLSEWLPRQVFDHIRTHTYEASIWTFNKIRDLEEHAEVIRECGLYVFDSSILSSGRQPTRRDIRVNAKYHKMLMETTKLQMDLMKRNITKQFGHNDKITIASSVGQLIGPKQNILKQTQLTGLHFGKKVD
jgi:hypothetical protein